MRISEIKNTQQFQDLCQSLLVAEDENTQIVRDSNGDQGIDAYVPSTRTLYAVYCPEVSPTPKLYYQRKIRSDLKKALNLRDNLGYTIDHWVFLTPAPLEEPLHRYLLEKAKASGFVTGINQSEIHLVNLLTKHAHLRSRFPELIIPDIESSIRDVREIIDNVGSQIGRSVKAETVHDKLDRIFELIAAGVLQSLTGPIVKALQEDRGIRKEVVGNPNVSAAPSSGSEGIWLVLGAAASAMSKNNIADMLKYSELALTMDSNEHHAWMVRALSLFGSNQYSEALASLKRALELKPDAYYAWFLQGTFLCILNEYDEAIRSFDFGLTINQDNHAWFLKGVALYAQDRLREALICFQRALELDPNDGHAWYLSAVTLCSIGNPEEAIESFKRALDILPEDDVLVDTIMCSYGRLLAQLHEYQKAIELFNLVVEMSPGNHDAWLYLGVALTQIKKYEEAASSYSNVLVLQPNNHIAWYSRGIVFNALFRPDPAIADFDRALELKSDFYQVWQGRATAFLMRFLGEVNQGKWAEAKLDWDAAVESAKRSREEIWYERLSETLLLTALKGHLEFVKHLIIQSNLGESLFPLARAIDYMLTGDNALIEKLAPEVDQGVKSIVHKLRHSQH